MTLSTNTGRLFVLSAPSGCGKTSLTEALLREQANLTRSISHTTRPPRPGERDGVDYHFVAAERFEAMAQAGEFLEYATVFDSRYGTARRSVEDQTAAGRDMILTIDWQGARAIKRLWPTAVTVFLLPPSRAELERRLRGRGQDSEENIARRMQGAIDEMRHYGEFDHVVVNDEFSAALADLKAVLAGCPDRRRPFTLAIDNLLRA